VHTTELPLKHGHDPLQLALHGGDDYELLFTVPPRKAKLLPEVLSRCASHPPLEKITRKRELLVLEENGRTRQLIPGGLGSLPLSQEIHKGKKRGASRLP